MSASAAPNSWPDAIVWASTSEPCRRSSPISDAANGAYVTSAAPVITRIRVPDRSAAGSSSSTASRAAARRAEQPGMQQHQAREQIGAVGIAEERRSLEVELPGIGQRGDEIREIVDLGADAVLLEARRRDLREPAHAPFLGYATANGNQLRLRRDLPSAAPGWSRRRRNRAAGPALRHLNCPGDRRDRRMRDLAAGLCSPSFRNSAPLAYPIDIARFVICRLQNEIFPKLVRFDRVGRISDRFFTIRASAETDDARERRRSPEPSFRDICDP